LAVAYGDDLDTLVKGREIEAILNKIPGGGCEC
jgi:hypothetical protein